MGVITFCLLRMKSHGLITFCLLRTKSHGGNHFLFTEDEVTWGLSLLVY